MNKPITTSSVFHSAHVIWQAGDDESSLGEPAIAVSHDSGPTVVLEQEGRTICANLSTIDALCKTLRKVAASAAAFEVDRKRGEKR
jgi:hypothetical protein